MLRAPDWYSKIETRLLQNIAVAKIRALFFHKIEISLIIYFPLYVFSYL